MESIRKSRVEMIVEKYRKAGKARTYTAEESEKLFEGVDQKMREVRAEVRRLEVASRVAAEKIVGGTLDREMNVNEKITLEDLAHRLRVLSG